MRRRRSPIRKGIRLLVVVILVFVGVQIWRSYETLVITQEQVITDKIQEPVRIAFLSDLHENSFGYDNNTLLKKLAKQQPNLIFVGGDMINENTQDFTDLEKLLKGLQEIAPVFYTPGNKELDNRQWDQEAEHIEAMGIPVLDGEYETVQIGKDLLQIGGLYDYTFALNGNDTVEIEKMDPKTVSFLQDFTGLSGYRILLAHRPDSLYFNQSKDYWDLDLVLSGHTHGGQVVLWNGQGLWAPDQGWFPEYAKGKTNIGKTTLITSAGLGSSGEKLPRFNNPCEILIVDLQNAQSAD